MSTRSGILDWSGRTEARLRQLNGSSLVVHPDDPLIPRALAERYRLRDLVELTVEIPGPEGDHLTHAHGAPASPTAVASAPQPRPTPIPVPAVPMVEVPTSIVKVTSAPSPKTPPGFRPLYSSHRRGGPATVWGGGRVASSVVTSPPPPAAPVPAVPLRREAPGPASSHHPAPAAAAGSPSPHGSGGRNGLAAPNASSPRRPTGRPVASAIVAIEGLAPDEYATRRPFEELTSIDPQPRLTLEYPGCPESCRLIDLFCPIGRGQRALIVSPPKAGKTTLLKDIAGGIVRNHPTVELMALLIDERPEEVTDFRRTFRAMGERCRVIASSNDQDTEAHVRVSLLMLERCKRMMEAGKHVVVVLDSLTRLGRAFNLSRRHASSGRTMSGGIDSRALEVPKQIFGAARNTEEAGSLTIIASCLVDTGSQGDQLIFEEFKGTGNMELILDRKISEKRVFPAINLAASGTRKEHLLMSESEYKTVSALRRRLLAMPGHQQMEQLLNALKRFPTNAALVGEAG
ncbi:MAG: transcription termination factor Rho [Phycisphaerae bacterium]|nr:transcription termination factor Rho [Phycisphaerae bacterium]